jgi:DNA-binding transcriptional regulator YiaG
MTCSVVQKGYLAPQPAPWNAARVRELRYTLSLSQPELAKHLNVSARSIKSWEQGEKHPGGAAARLLDLIEQHPEWLLGSRIAAVTPTVEGLDDKRPREGATTLRHYKPRPLPDWWREHTIVRLTEILRFRLTRMGKKYLLLGRPCADAPATLEAATCALGPGAFPDIAIFPPEAATSGHWNAIKWVRLVVDVLPATRPAGSTSRNFLRWPDLEIKERWIVDPFAHRITVCRPDAPTRHYTQRLVWCVDRFAHPLEIVIPQFFSRYAQFPDADWLLRNPHTHSASVASDTSPTSS